MIELHSTINGTTSIHLTEIIETVKNRAISIWTEIELLKLVKTIFRVIWSDTFQKVNIVSGVEKSKFLVISIMGTIDIKLLIDTVGHEKRVNHL